MHIKNYKGRCEKRTLPKCRGTAVLYDDVMIRAAERLSKDADIASFETNTPSLDGYTTDFYVTFNDGSIGVIECVKDYTYLRKPKTAKLLDMSKKCWKEKGVSRFIVLYGEARA